MIFKAVIHKLGAIPESEMAEVKTFDSLPDNLTYPAIPANGSSTVSLQRRRQKNLYEVVKR